MERQYNIQVPVPTLAHFDMYILFSVTYFEHHSVTVPDACDHVSAH